MHEKETLHFTKKEENTMTASVKTTNQAFVLNQKNSEAFLKQDNASFKNLMAKFEKFTTKRSPGISEKK